MSDGATVHVQWRSVVTEENGQAYNFPHKFTPFMRNNYSIAAVYRWRVLRVQNGNVREPIYIGEGEDLIRRMQRVLTPPKAGKKGNTNRRLHDLFDGYVAEGRSIVIEIADVEPFELNGIRFGRGTLADRFKRRALENILLVVAQNAATDCELLNVIVDPVEKATLEIAKLMKKSPELVKEALKKLQSRTTLDS